MSMNVGGSKGSVIADINVTPMADIMIVLLIIFMVITPMLQKGVDVRLPLAGNTKERKDEQKTITVAIVHAEMKRGLSGLATIGSTAPFVGLFGTTFGIINAFSGMALTGSGGIAAISAGIAEALITTAFGLFVAVPAVWAYNYFAGKVEGFNVEMDNSSSELLDYFIKKGA